MITLIVRFVFVTILSARGVARIYTDYLWFDSLRFTSVWSGVSPGGPTPGSPGLSGGP